MNEKIKRTAFCPHCGNIAPHKLILMHLYDDTAWNVSDGTVVDDYCPAAYYVACCETCNQILMYHNWAEGSEPELSHFDTSYRVWPKSGKLHPSVPKKIADIYQEAARIKEIAPNSYAVQIRRALEAICEDRGAKKGTLFKRLAQLAEKGEVPPILVEVSGLLRLIGNIGAHAAEKSVHPLFVETIDDFFRALIEYLYIAPSKVIEFRKRLDKFRSEI